MARKKILLVDHSPQAQLFHRMVLAREPYDLIVAHDGQEGVEKAIAERPHLILMDAGVPGVDGVEACRRLRARGETAEIPVLLITPQGGHESAASGRAAGCSDCLPKPLHPADLLSKVRSLLAA